MIENCTIVSITTPPAPTSDGDLVAGTTTAIGKRGFIDEPRRAQLLALANKVTDVSAVLMAPIAIAAQLVPQAQVVVRIDEIGLQAPQQILHVVNRIKSGGLSHVEVYLKGL